MNDDRSFISQSVHLFRASSHLRSNIAEYCNFEAKTPETKLNYIIPLDNKIISNSFRFINF